MAAELTGGATVVCDLNRSMMDAGRSRTARIGWIQGNAEAMGFLSNAFDAAIVGFGVRNLVDLEKGLGEMFRALKESGRLLLLEFSVPASSWLCPPLPMVFF